MKGLLIKDSYLVFKQSKLLVIIAFVLMIINAVAVFFGEENMIGIFIIQNFAASLGLASITNDETYKWNIYCDTLPVSRKKVVVEKYLFGFLCIFSMWFISVLVTEISKLLSDSYNNSAASVIDDIGFDVMILAFTMLMPTIIFPLIFKFGIVKARLVFFIAIGCYGAFVGIGTSIFDSEGENPSAFASENFIVIAIAVLAAAALVYTVSMLISVKIYENKEL